MLWYSLWSASNRWLLLFHTNILYVQLCQYKLMPCSTRESRLATPDSVFLSLSMWWLKLVIDPLNMFTRSLFCLLYFFIHSILKSSAILQQMQFLENENAKNKFCSQKFFDTLSYDGQSYRFTVKYRHNDFTHFSSSIEKFYYDEFKIRYHPSSKLFTYQMTTYNFANRIYLNKM